MSTKTCNAAGYSLLHYAADCVTDPEAAKENKRGKEKSERGKEKSVKTKTPNLKLIS